MELETCKPSLPIPCEFCGKEAKLLCFCRKASLCETCIGRHLISEPSLPHKPITFSQSEIAALYEKEFTQLKETEEKVKMEAWGRQEFVRVGKGRLMEEIQKMETFKCTCLEYVAVAVEITKQKLVQAAESVGKDMLEACDSSKHELEAAIQALDLGEPHWAISELDNTPGLFWQGHVDLKELDLVDVLRRGIEFSLTVNRPISDRKHSQKPDPVAKPRPDPQKPAQKPTGKSTPRTGVKTTIESRRADKLNQSLAGMDAGYKKDLDCPSPEPPVGVRCMTESPSNGNFGFGARTALIQQTAKHVNEMSDLVKTFRSSKAGEALTNLSLTQRAKGPMPLGELNYSFNPFDSPVAKTSKHFGRGRDREEWEKEGRTSLVTLQEVIPEEMSTLKCKPCLYFIPSGSTSLRTHDLESGLTSLKTFDGIDPFPKFTFWCVSPTGEVFIIGGVTAETQPSTVKKTCFVYSPQQDTIENGPNLTTARHSCSAICVKDILFVTGGIGTDLSPIKDCEKLDLKTRKWRRIANLNVARESHGLTVHLGRMYVAGGPGEQSMETYNPVNDRWSLLHFKVTAGGKACAFSMGDRVVILHDKAVTYAWVDKRTSEHVRDLEEKGWWLGGPPIRFGASIYLQRGAVVYIYSPDSSDLRKIDF